MLERKSIRHGIKSNYGFLMSVVRLSRGWVTSLTSHNLKYRDRAERPWLLSRPISLLLTPTQPTGSGRQERESNP